MKRQEAIRKEILMQLYAVRPIGLTPERIARDAVKAGYDYTATEVAQELTFLEDNQLVVEQKNPVGTSRPYRIHALGVTHYEQNFAA
jgi:hypothetical protein